MINFKLIFLMLFFQAFLYIASVSWRGSSGGQSVGFITRRSGVQVSPSLLNLRWHSFLNSNKEWNFLTNFLQITRCLERNLFNKKSQINGIFYLCGETETRTRGTLTRSQISNLLHYHSATSPN